MSICLELGSIHLGRLCKGESSALVIRSSKLPDPVLPVRLIFQELIDLVIEVSDTVLTQGGILDVRDLPYKLTDDSFSPLFTVLHVITVLRVMRPSLPLLGVELPLHLNPSVKHGHGLLLITCHFLFG